MVPRLFASTFTLAGAFTLAAVLTGCGGTSGGFTTTTPVSSSGSLAAGGAANVYALDDVSSTSTTAANDMLEYPAASSGSSTAPSVTIPLSTLTPTGVALDGTGSLYVAGVDDTTYLPSVNVYAAGAVSGAAPIRSFSLNAAFQPIGLAVSSAGQAYVLEGEYDARGDVLATEIEVFATGASSGAAASSVIGGSGTQMVDPQDIAVDTAGNVYVANYQDDGASQILVFAAGANGSAMPTQVVAFNNDITGIAVDGSMNMYTAEVSSAGNASVVEYAAGANGTATATRTISGATTGLNAATPGAVRVDAAGNIWLIQQGNSTTFSAPVYFEAWPPSASGNVAPAVQFAPPSLVNANGAFAIR